MSVVRTLLTIALTFTVTACQQGKREESASVAVHRESVSKCDEISSELKELNVDLENEASSLGTNGTQLPDAAKEKASLDKIQPLLERYLDTADKLLEIGDTKVVVFPEKSRISAARKRAVTYLGEVYAHRDWQMQERGAYSSDEVDREEYRIRSLRVSNALLVMKLAGFGYTNPEDVKKYPRIVRKMQTIVIVDQFANAHQALKDAPRMKEIAERADYWNNDIYRKTVRAMNSVGLLYIGSLHTALAQEMAKRAPIDEALPR